MVYRVTLCNRIILNSSKKCFAGNADGACLALKELDLPYPPFLGLCIDGGEVESIDFYSESGKTLCALSDVEINIPNIVENFKSWGWTIIEGGTDDDTDIDFQKYRNEFKR